MKSGSSEEREFNGKEFQLRWLKARISALNKVSKIEATLETSISPSSSSLEAELVDQYFSESPAGTPKEMAKQNDLLLREVFDRSRLLGLSLSKYLRLTFEIQDFEDLLRQSAIPCVQGAWEARKTARILSRDGCAFGVKSGSHACDYWREALDGLVMGLGEKERLARHACVRHGDKACVDVFYLDGGERQETSLAWGPLPEHMAGKLEKICEDFEIKMKAPIAIKGLSEGVLYFEFKSSTDVLCGGGQLLTSTFQRKIHNSYPGLRVQEVTPRAVLGVE